MTAAQKNSARDSVDCPGGDKEAMQHPLSTGNCNCWASEEERPNKLLNLPGAHAERPAECAENRFLSLRETYARSSGA